MEKSNAPTATGSTPKEARPPSEGTRLPAARPSRSLLFLGTLFVPG